MVIGQDPYTVTCQVCDPDPDNASLPARRSGDFQEIVHPVIVGAEYLRFQHKQSIFPSIEGSLRIDLTRGGKSLNGGGRMPTADRLSENDRNAIIDFLFGIETPAHRRVRADNIPPYVFRGFQRWFDDEGYPAIKPPWGTLNAIDLNTGTIKWKVPLGEFEELTERGIPITGTENTGDRLLPPVA